MDEKQRSPDMQGNILDRAIAWVSPKLGYVRMAWRNAVRGAYQAGEITRRSEGWIPVNAKAEQINQPARDLIRARARYAENNNDIITGPLGMLERNVVSIGFQVQPDTDNDDLNAQILAAFREWQKPCNCDITGEQAFWELCQMVVRRTVVDGGILFIKTYTGNPRFPFQLQAREVDDLDSAGQFRNGNNIIVNGVEVDSNQKAAAYWLKKYTPDGWFSGYSERIPANRVIYLKKKTLPSQIREMSMLAPTLMRVNDTEEFLEAVSIKEKILASLSVFIKRMLPGGASPGRGGTSLNNPDYDPKTGYKKKRVSPGLIMELQPGDDVSAVIPNGQASNTKEFVALHQRLIGSGQGLSYEAASRDMSEVNYSSARQGLLEDQKTYGCWQQWLIDHFLSEVFTEFMISAVLAGELVIKDFWQKKSLYLKHQWIEPGWSWIDPVKEITANKIAIETGQDSLANVCARVGYDWREIKVQQYKEAVYDMEQQAKLLAFKKEMEVKYGVTIDNEGGKQVAEKKSSSAVGGKPGT